MSFRIGGTEFNTFILFFPFSYLPLECYSYSLALKKIFFYIILIKLPHDQIPKYQIESLHTSGGSLLTITLLRSLENAIYEDIFMQFNAACMYWMKKREKHTIEKVYSMSETQTNSWSVFSLDILSFTYYRCVRIMSEFRSTQLYPKACDSCLHTHTAFAIHFF